MLNKVILKGNIGRVPEIRVTQSGQEIAILSLVTAFIWKDKSGEWQKHKDWHQIVVFRESTVRLIKEVLEKGDPLYVEGRLSYKPWTDKFNQPRWLPQIVITKQEGKIESLRLIKPEPNTETYEEENCPLSNDEFHNLSFEDNLSFQSSH